MKRNVKIYLFKRRRKIKWDDDSQSKKFNVLDLWPDLMLCVELYYQNHLAMKLCHRSTGRPIELRYTERFMKSLDKHCTTDALKLRLIDALAKIVYKIPHGALRDTPIRERTKLWHFYVSDFWRVFYRRRACYMILEEFSPHKKQGYPRRY